MNDTPELRRLRRELAMMRKLCDSTPAVRFAATGEAPVEYAVILRCSGLVLDQLGYRIVHEHRFVLQLDADFPIAPPHITWLTPIFHPNFRVPRVCIGDAWFAGATLAELCTTLMEMVRMKTFNLADPLDKSAAVWLDRMLASGELSVPIDIQRPEHVAIEIGAARRTVET